jgi:iron uptake system EfeUOB component EfeO/EfeM
MKNTLLVIAALAIVSCKQQIVSDVQTAPTQIGVNAVVTENGDLNVTDAVEDVTFKTEEASQIHAAYLSLKGALVNTDPYEAAEIASNFKSTLESQTESDITRGLNDDLALISVSKDAAEQRVAFENISKKVEVYLSSEITSGIIYKQYCPMAFEGKGAYWLSNSKEIRNPYYGDKMLKCGVVDKEIQQ